jgi:uncharacterized membrane protein (DUF373 family)
MFMQKVAYVYKFQIGWIGIMALAFFGDWLKSVINNLFFLLIVVALYLLLIKFLADKFGKYIE